MTNEENLRRLVQENIAQLQFPVVAQPLVITTDIKGEEYHFAHIHFDAGPKRSLLHVRFQPDRSHFEINNIQLDKALRGEGWGRKLVTMSEDMARALGATYIDAHSVANKSRDFWSHFGYMDLRHPERVWRKYFS